MKPSDLYREIALEKARELYGGQITPERNRSEDAKKFLRQRAADIFDKFELKAGLGLDTDNVSYKEMGRVKVHTKIAAFALPLPLEIMPLYSDSDMYDDLNINIALGANDVSYRQDAESEWSPPNRCASLDVLTTIYGKVADGNDYDEVFQRLERLNYVHPVLEDYLHDGDIPFHYHFLPQDHMHRVEGFHGALDLADQYLSSIK
jgi:hypothetical protein